MPTNPIIRRYLRGDESREIEIDGLTVTHRGFYSDDPVRTYGTAADLESALSLAEEDLLDEGFSPEGRPFTGYRTSHARRDYSRIAEVIEVAEEVQQRVGFAALTWRGAPDAIRLLRAMLRMTPGARDALRDRPGDLWTLCFGATDDELDAYDIGCLDPIERDLVEGGKILGAAGLDAWIRVGDEVWRVHPEGVSSRGSAAEFMAEAVRQVVEG